MSKGKTAIITGATGQDSSHLSELLLSKIEYDRVIGLVRRSSTNTHERLRNALIEPRFELVEADITDPSSIFGIISQYKPDEYYNLAAQSHVATSFEQPSHTFDVNTVGVLNALEAIKRFSPKTRFYQASTSEMFGSNFTSKWHNPLLVQSRYVKIVEIDGEDVRHKDLYIDDLHFDGIEDAKKISYKTEIDETKFIKFQDENTALSPNSPYAVAKVAAHHLVDLYRRSYGIHASAGILFNHEGERRGENFVSRKITKYVGKLHRYRNSLDGLRMDPNYEKLHLGNLDAQRDWGYAPDYVEAMYLMLQQDTPNDFIICTGECHTIRDFLSEAFKLIGIADWTKYVVVDPKFYRPCEVEFLRGNASKAKSVLGWEPKTRFKELVHKMVRADIEA